MRARGRPGGEPLGAAEAGDEAEVVSGWPNFVLGGEMKSQASASSQPPPSAKPFTAAITGLDAPKVGRGGGRGARKRGAGDGGRPSGDVGARDERLFAGAGQDERAHARDTASAFLSALSHSPALPASRLLSALSAFSRARDGDRANPALDVRLTLFRFSSLHFFCFLIFFVRVEAAADLAARAAERRRTAAAAAPERYLSSRRARRAKPRGDREAGIEADEVGELERPHGMIEAELYSLVDVLGAAEPSASAKQASLRNGINSD